MTTDIANHETALQPVPRRRRGSWMGLVSVGVASLGWGLFLGMVLLRPSPEPKTVPAAVTSRPPALPTPPPPEPPPPLDARQFVQRADFMLQFGNIPQAIEIYQEAMPSFEPGQRGWLTYRLAIAHELLGDSEQALQWYRRLHRERSNPMTQVLAEAGRARVMLQSGDVRSSHRVLRSIESDPSFPQVPADLQRMISHLLAQAYAVDVAQSIPPSWTWRAVPNLYPTSGSLLQLFLDPASTIPTEAPSTHFDVTVQLGSFAEQTYISCYLPAVRLDNVISQLAAALGVPLHMTEDATQRLGSRLQHVRFQDASVALALDAVLDPVDLMWQEEAGRLTVLTSEEGTADAVRQWKIQLARRAITRALVLAPEDELARNTKFLQASVEVVAGQWEAARSVYEEVLQGADTAAEMDAWWFNYADVLFQLGQLSPAVDAYYHVVDQGGQSNTTAIAYLRIGQILLDKGRYEESLRPLIRGVSLANEADIQSAASLSLACAYLLIDNPRAALTALLEARNAIRDGDYRHQGNLLESLCRDRISHNKSEAAKIQRDLFSSVSRVVPEELVVDVAWLLLGEAYERLGLAGEAERLFTHSRQIPLALHVADQIEERLVEHYISSRQWDKVQALLSPRLDDPDPRQAIAARLHWADVLLLQDRPLDCIRICRQTLALEPTDAEKAQLLQWMGRAFQSQQQFEQAALCFAGLLPASGDH